MDNTKDLIVTCICGKRKSRSPLTKKDQEQIDKFIADVKEGKVKETEIPF